MLRFIYKITYNISKKSDKKEVTTNFRSDSKNFVKVKNQFLRINKRKYLGFLIKVVKITFLGDSLKK